MESPLTTFENYVASLKDLGVFPSFHRHHNGWTCILRNSANQQLMPLQIGESCWGETLMAALTTAVNDLNQSFSDPKELHRYIDTGINKTGSPVQTIENIDVYQKEPAPRVAAGAVHNRK